MEPVQINHWQKDAVIRGLVNKRFPRQDLVQLLIGHSMVTAKLTASLDLGKTYWFQIEQTGLTPALHVLTTGATYTHLLDCWGVRPNRFVLTLLTLFEQIQCPFSEAMIKEAQEIQKQDNLSLAEWVSILSFIKTKHLPLTSASLKGTVALNNNDETIAQVLSVIMKKENEDAWSFVKACIHTMNARETELFQQVYPFTIQSLTSLSYVQQELVTELRKMREKVNVNQAYNELFSKLELMLLIPNAFHESHYCFVSKWGTDWVVHFTNEGEKKEIVIIHLQGFVSMFGYLSILIRMKENQLFLAVRSKEDEPSWFSAKQKGYERKLAEQGFVLTSCKWIKQVIETPLGTNRTGVDMRL
ncbi:hypothetical protein JCM19045_2077 [Bacillus sp. JCM 19045]|nr:hypothetical protein JCM19045_2077 [Bacillus sp. JCM 19045]